MHIHWRAYYSPDWESNGRNITLEQVLWSRLFVDLKELWRPFDGLLFRKLDNLSDSDERQERTRVSAKNKNKGDTVIRFMFFLLEL
jgi:hypothetical protein